MLCSRRRPVLHNATINKRLTASLSFQSSPQGLLKCPEPPRWPRMTGRGAVKVMWSGRGKEKKKIKKFPRIITSLHPQAGGVETEMDACRVYEGPVAVRSPTKTCHTSGSAGSRDGDEDWQVCVCAWGRHLRARRLNVSGASPNI